MQGTATAIEGQEVCSACEVGTYAGVAGLTVCRPCANGTIAPQPGARHCEACPAGKVCDGSGAAARERWCFFLLVCARGVPAVGRRLYRFASLARRYTSF